MGKFSVVIVGGGRGSRFGQPAKILTPIQGKPILDYSIDSFAAHPDCAEIVVVLGSHTIGNKDDIAARFNGKSLKFTLGGATRSASVVAGLRSLSSDAALVAVHDAARPFIAQALIASLLDAAIHHGAAAPTMPVSDTLHQISPDGTLNGTVDRTRLRAAQTPQIACREWLEAALRRHGDETDEASALVTAGYPVISIPGDPDNLKITWPEDLERAKYIAIRRQERS